jgi:hypothetical protein
LPELLGGFVHAQIGKVEQGLQGKFFSHMRSEA